MGQPTAVSAPAGHVDVPRQSGRGSRRLASGLVHRLREDVTAWAAATSRLDIVVLLTLLLLIMRPLNEPVLVAQLFCFAGILYRPVTRRPAFWLVLVGLWVVLFLPSQWPTADNHKWLVIYWVLALGIAMHSTEPMRVLAVNGRLLIGLVFLFATLWKVFSPDFPGGGFFHFTLINDVRFETVARLVGGLEEGASASNRAVISSWDDATVAVSPTVLQDGPRVALLAQVMAVGTILIEGLVAAVYLAPDRWRIARAREMSLLLFVLLTYPIAPVVGFGWLLVIMGLAASRLRRPIADVAFVLAFLAIYAFNAVDKVVNVLWRSVSALTGG